MGPANRQTYFFLIFMYCIACGFCQLPSICKSNCKKAINETETYDYCQQHHDLLLESRCCVNKSTADVQGIDLQECNMTTEAFAKGIKRLWHLAVISLQDNPMMKDINKTDFNNNTEIKYLSLPLEIKHCPGGDDIWGSAVNDTDFLLCKDELDPCTVHNLTCPQHSVCNISGINMTQCHCAHGYYGYKCMKSGDFPYKYFGIGLGAPTVLLCMFLWFTQRRHVKTKPKYT